MLDWPGAVLEGKASSARSAAAQRDVLEFAITAAMKRQLGKASSEEVKTAVDGMVLEYLSRHHGRKRVLEHAATELENDPPIEDAKSELSDDFMAFFKGKVDNLGTEEARVLFGKVLAGEVKRPGSFSKAAMSILAEMDTEVGQLFDRLCNMSVAHPLVRTTRFDNWYGKR